LLYKQFGLFSTWAKGDVSLRSPLTDISPKYDTWSM